MSMPYHWSRSGLRELPAHVQTVQWASMPVRSILMVLPRRKDTYVTLEDVIKCTGRLHTCGHISVGTLGRDRSFAVGLTAESGSRAQMSCSVISGPTLARNASSVTVAASVSCAVTTFTSMPRRTKSRKEVEERMTTAGTQSHLIRSLHPVRSWLQTPRRLVTA